MGWSDRPIDQNVKSWEELDTTVKEEILDNHKEWFDAGGLGPCTMPPTYERVRDDSPPGEQVKWSARDGVNIGVERLTTVNGPL